MAPVFEKLEPVYLGLVNLLALISGLMFAIFTGWIGLEVLMRSFDLPRLPGLVDYTEYAIYCMAILAAPWILHHGGHVRVLILPEALPLRGRVWLESLGDLICAVVCLVLCYYSLGNFLTSYARNELIFSELIIPEWWLQWQAPLAFLMLTIGFVREILLLWRRGPLPETTVGE
ncbi:TRAP transporter small permease [Paracoccus sp. (in: a-proteobacteria)]|uniref:TRAP transporter small permease n=1 Tax=Paracoccus sp. TaxID=267 RepID=UPI003A8497C7